MERACFEREYEINASRNILFPYIHTAGGLAQWFADDVNLDPKKNFLFHWDGEVQPAILANSRRDQYVRFEYLPKEGELNGHSLEYIEFFLEKNEFTDTTFLRIVDCSGEMEEEELEDIWEGMIDTLKELVGG